MTDLKIVSYGGKAHIWINGEYVSRDVLGFRIEKDGTDTPNLTLEIDPYSTSISIDDVLVSVEKKNAAPADADTASGSRNELRPKRKPLFDRIKSFVFHKDDR